jgi:hypothetical protein
MPSYNALAPAPTNSLAAYMQREFGFDPNIERLTLMPYPKGALTPGAKVNYQDWVAPQVLYEAAKAFALPSFAYQGGQYTPEDVANMAGTIAGGGMMVGSAPANSLAMSIIRRQRGSDKTKPIVSDQYTVPQQPTYNQLAQQIPTNLPNYSELIRNLPLEKPGMIRLFHGSPQKDLKTIENKGIFGGIFANQESKSALSHGDNLYYTDIPKSSILQDFSNLPINKVKDFVKNNVANNSLLKTKNNSYVDELADLIIKGKSGFNSRIPEQDLLKILRTDDIGEASWELQRLRGKLASQFGYKVAEMPDEHGISHLILPGAQVSPVK